MQKIIPKLPVLFVIVAYIVLGYSFFHFIYSYTIRIPYASEWSMARLVLDKVRPAYFFLQIQEHRVGTVFIYLQLLAHLTHWNMLYETFSIGLLLLVASFFALRIKHYFTKSVDYWDAIIPFIFLNLAQRENILWGININHVLPTFFLLWTTYTFTRTNSKWRHHILVGIAFLSAYSSFQGLVVDFIIFGYFVAHLFQKFTKKQHWKPFFVYSIGILCVMASYFVGFDRPIYLGPDTVTFSFIVQFIAREITAAIGDYRTTWTMWVLPLGVLISICVGIWQWINHRFSFQYYAIVCLFAYSILFLVFIACGRGVFGLEFSRTSRYVTYLSPLFFGCYLIGRLYMKGWMKWVGIFFFVWYICGSILYRSLSIINAKNWFMKVEQWKACYLQYEDFAQCDEQTGYQIYPYNAQIQSQMDGLKQQRLNLFYR